MLKDADISFFHYSCDNTRSDVVHLLKSLDDLVCLGDNCYTSEDKKILPQYLKKLSADIPDIEFVHTYAFTLANNTGYSIFKAGEVVYQHIEGLAERLTELRLDHISVSEEKMHLEFIHFYYPYALDFESKPEEIKITAHIAAQYFSSLEARDFSDKIKQYLTFSPDTDLLLQEKACKILKQKDLIIHLNRLQLEKKNPRKITKRSYS